MDHNTLPRCTIPDGPWTYDHNGSYDSRHCIGMIQRCIVRCCVVTVALAADAASFPVILPTAAQGIRCAYPVRAVIVGSVCVLCRKGSSWHPAGAG